MPCARHMPAAIHRQCEIPVTPMKGLCIDKIAGQTLLMTTTHVGISATRMEGLGSVWIRHQLLKAYQEEKLARGVPARSTFWGVDQSCVKTSSSIPLAMGRKLKMPPPELLMRTTVSGGLISPAATQLIMSFSCDPVVPSSANHSVTCFKEAHYSKAT